MLLRRWPSKAVKEPKPALLRTLAGHGDSVTSVSVTPDGRCALSGSFDETLRLWDLETGICLGLRHDELFYWAPTEGGTEVDFLIKRGKEFTAIEVKAKERLSAHDFKGLKAIAELKGIGRRLVVFQGDRPFRTEDGIEALPIREFLQELEGKTI